MSGDTDSVSSFSLSVGNDSYVHCFRYADKTPILHVSGGGVTLTISPKGRNATDSALDFARTLAREVKAFAAEVERLHAEGAEFDAAEQAA